MRYAWLLGVLMLAGCAGSRPPSAIPSSDAALQAALTRHISVLASDEFGGREPGTEGEAKTLRYLAREWQAAGLVSGTNDPGNEHGFPYLWADKKYWDVNRAELPFDFLLTFIEKYNGLQT